MKKIILGVVIGIILTCGVAYAVDMLIPAASISYQSEYTTKTNVADAIDELLKNAGSCPIGFKCEQVCTSVSSSTIGETIRYAGLNWKVVSTDEEGTTLILAENYKTDSFDKNNKVIFEESDSYTLLNETFINEDTSEYLKDKVEYNCLISQGKSVDKDDYYIRLPEKEELSENISNNSSTPFWTQTANGDKLYYADKDGTDGKKYTISSNLYYATGSLGSTNLSDLQTYLPTSIRSSTPVLILSSTTTLSDSAYTTSTSAYYGTSYFYPGKDNASNVCTQYGLGTNGNSGSNKYYATGTCERLTVYSYKSETLGIRPVIKVKRIVED